MDNKEYNEFINNIIEPFQELEKLQIIELEKVRLLIKEYIENNNQDEEEISHLFDLLLDLTYWFGNKIKDTYYTLINYVKTFNSELAIDYENFFKEIVPEEEIKLVKELPQ